MKISQNKRNIIVSLPIIVILSLAFTVIIFSPYITPAKAFTNVWSNLATTFCPTQTACTNPLTLTGTVSTIGDLLTVSVSCASSNTVTSVIDSKSNSWALVATLSLTVGNNYVYTTTSQGNPDTEVWYAKAGATGSTIVSINYGSVPISCIYTFNEANTASVAFNSAFSNSLYTYSANYQTNGISISASGNIPSSSMVLQVSAEYSIAQTSGTEGAYCNGSAGCSGLGNVGTTLLGGGEQWYNCSGNCNYPDASVTGGEYVLNAQSPTSLSANTNSLSNFNSQNKGAVIGTLIVIFSSSGGLPPTGSSQIIIGCPSGSTPSTSNALSASTTYYFTAYTNGIATGTFAQIVNISAWIKSITWTGTHNIYFSIFTSNVNIPAGQLPSVSSPWNDIQDFSFLNVPANSNPQHLSVEQLTPQGSLSTLAIVGPNEGIAIGITADTAGVNLGTCPSSMGTVYSQAGALGAVGTRLNSANSVAFSISLSAITNLPLIQNTQTVTTIATTITSVTTLTTGTVTTTITSTTTLLSLLGGQGGVFVLNNILLVTPVWLIPLVMGGLFGLIGVFLGLIMGMVIGTLIGIVPIWADILLLVGVTLIIVRREI